MEGNLVIITMERGSGKKLCCPNGNLDIQDWVNQSKKFDSVYEKEMLSSATMGHIHPTQRTFSAGYSLQRTL